jgi:hypothetical protein
LPRSSAACLRRPQRFPTDACPSELLPPEKRFSRHRESLPPCRSTATPLRLRGLVPLGNPLRRGFVAEPHHPMLSWASQLGAPPGHASRTIRERTGRSHQGSARTQTDPVARSTRSVPPPPEGSDHTERTGKERSGRHHCRATMPADLRPSATPPKRCPRRSAPRATSSPLANPAAPREVIGRCRHDSPEGARTASASELSMVPCAAWVRPPKRATPSAPPRSVRSAAAVEGVRVADGLIGSRSVAQGRAIGAKTPASARRREVPSNVSTARVRSVARAALLRRAAVPNVGV